MRWPFVKGIRIGPETDVYPGIQARRVMLTPSVTASGYLRTISTTFTSQVGTSRIDTKRWTNSPPAIASSPSFDQARQLVAVGWNGNVTSVNMA